MMQCPSRDAHGPEVFVSYASGELSADALAELEQHFTVCPECRATGNAQKALWCALDEWHPATISPDFDAKVFARIEAGARLPWYKRLPEFHLPIQAWPARYTMRHAMPVGAACAALVAAFLLRGPLPEMRQGTVRERTVNIEQVERALDDIDMLKQLGIAPAAGNQSARQESL